QDSGGRSGAWNVHIRSTRQSEAGMPAPRARNGAGPAGCWRPAGAHSRSTRAWWRRLPPGEERMPNGMPSGLSRGPRRTSGGDFAESEVHGERELPRSPLGREVDLAQLKRQSRIQAWVSSSQQRWSTFSERRRLPGLTGALVWFSYLSWSLLVALGA